MIYFWQAMATAGICMFLAMGVGGLVKAFDIQRYWYGLVLILALSMAIWAYMIVPSSGLDLYRLWGLVDMMRAYRSSIGDALVALGEEDIYESLVFFRLLCYMVSRTPSNQWLPFVSTFIVFSLIGYLVIDFLRTQKYSSRMVLPSIALIFMGMQLQYIFSGIRNPMAVALTLTGLYLIFYKKRAYVLAVLLLLMGATTHSMVLIVLPAVLVCQIPKAQTIFRVTALAAMPIIFALAEVMLQLPLALLQSTGVRILYYLDRHYLFDRPEVIANISVFVVTGLTYWMMGRLGSLPPNTEGWRKYMNAYYFLGCMMIGCVVRRDFCLRIGYIMGFAAVPVVCRVLSVGRSRRTSSTERLLMAMVVMVQLVCCAKVFYDTWFVLRQWEFL